MASTPVDFVALKHSNAAGDVPLPAELEIGEVAVNIADLILYTKDATGTVQPLGGGPSSGPTISASAMAPAAPGVGDIWVDVSNPDHPAAKIFNGQGAWVEAIPIDGISLDTTGPNGSLQLILADAGTF